jgi:predicted anti-sigma-YlaC factor YlaD
MSVELILSALLWMTFATLVSQAVAIAVLAWLGLPPGKLAHEIEDIQNPAVGASFFIISLAASIFISIMASAGFTPDPSFAEGAAWIIGGLVVAALYVFISFNVAYRIMKPRKGESLYRYMQREIIEEQNVALTFFLGGLGVIPFIAVVFQLI